MLMKNFKNTSIDNINALYMLFIFIRFLKTKDICQSWNVINSCMISCPCSIKGILVTAHQHLVPLPCFYLTPLLDHQCKSHGEKTKKPYLGFWKVMTAKLPWKGLRGRYLLRSANHNVEIAFLGYSPYSRREWWQHLSHVHSQSPFCFVISVWYTPQYRKKGRI